MDSITHANNYNNKLLCDFFPDVRLDFPNRFTLGAKFEHHLERVGLIGVATIVSANRFQFKHINDALAFQIFGQNAGFMTKMLQQFYEYKLKPDTTLVHIVWHLHKRNPDTIMQLFHKPLDKILSQMPEATAYNDGPHLTT